MRRHHDRRPAGVDVAQQLEHAARGALIEVAGRLVGEQHRRLVDERPGDRDALLLAAGQLARVGLRLGREPDLREHAHDARRDASRAARR